jgi:hypothetical protein
MRIRVKAADKAMRGPNEARRLEDRIFTVPNALSLARLFMVPSVIAFHRYYRDGE